MNYQLSALFKTKWEYLLSQGFKLVNDEVVGGVFKRKFQRKETDGTKTEGMINEFGRVEWYNNE